MHSISINLKAKLNTRNFVSWKTDLEENLLTHPDLARKVRDGIDFPNPVGIIELQGKIQGLIAEKNNLEETIANLRDEKASTFLKSGLFLKSGRKPDDKV